MEVLGLIYLCTLPVGFVLGFFILRGMKLELKFAQGNTKIIKLAYFVLSIIIAHLLASTLVFMGWAVGLHNISSL